MGGGLGPARKGQRRQFALNSVRGGRKHDVRLDLRQDRTDEFQLDFEPVGVGRERHDQPLGALFLQDIVEA